MSTSSLPPHLKPSASWAGILWWSKICCLSFIKYFVITDSRLLWMEWNTEKMNLWFKKVYKLCTRKMESDENTTVCIQRCPWGGWGGAFRDMLALNVVEGSAERFTRGRSFPPFRVFIYMGSFCEKVLVATPLDCGLGFTVPWSYSRHAGNRFAMPSAPGSSLPETEKLHLLFGRLVLYH